MQIHTGDCMFNVGGQEGDTLAMAQRLQQGGEVVLHICRPFRFIVKALDKSKGQLGLSVMHSAMGTAIYIQDVSVQGLVGLHGEACPQLRVLPGDLIVEVNGRRDKARVLMKHLESERVLSLTIDRPTRRPVGAP